MKMRHRDGQSYAVLTMCRALYACTHGEQVSKKRAALWTQAYLPQWAPMIQRAWSWRSKGQDEVADDEATFSEVVRFVHDVIGRVTGTRGEHMSLLRRTDTTARRCRPGAEGKSGTR